MQFKCLPYSKSILQKHRRRIHNKMLQFSVFNLTKVEKKTKVEVLLQKQLGKAATSKTVF